MQLLAATRGYPDQYLFTGFPSGTVWRHVPLPRAEVASRARDRRPIFDPFGRRTLAVAIAAARRMTGVAAQQLGHAFEAYRLLRLTTATAQASCATPLDARRFRGLVLPVGSITMIRSGEPAE